MIPSSIREALAEAFGPISDVRRVGGGCINEAAELESGGRRLFVKWNRGSDPGMFTREAEGLLLLRGAGALRVPEPYLWEESARGRSAFLVMEHFGFGEPGAAFADQLGRGLARQHRVLGAEHGLEHDNFIGSLSQSNRPSAGWVDFFAERRIGAQASLARSRGLLPSRVSRGIDGLLAGLAGLVPDRVEASLLHGDLWCGNFSVAADGSPVIFDPAVYHGHREVELAFTELFGGFPRGFYSAYAAEWPLDPGYEERREIYNLYPLLVHVNLFGGAYVSQVASVVRRFC